MKKLQKEDIDQGVFDLYDDYAHDRIPRRLFMDKLSTYAVGGLTVASLLGFISPDYVKKIQVPQDDPELKSEFITMNPPKEVEPSKDCFPDLLMPQKTPRYYCGSRESWIKSAY